VANLRERVLADCAALKVPLRAEQLDALLSRAEQEGMSHLDFAHRLLSEQADQRRERGIAYRIREACFRDAHTLAAFDWQFNAQAINRTQIEELATADFVRRKDNLVLVGQSGVGKSHIIEALGRSACAVGYRVRYTTSAGLIEKLTAAMADRTLPRRVRYFAGFDLLIVDEFGFDRLERREAQDAASLLFKVIDARMQKHATALVTNVDFGAWGE
jgi:DNA replication protein DnaC